MNSRLIAARLKVYEEAVYDTEVNLRHSRLDPDLRQGLIIQLGIYRTEVLALKAMNRATF